MSSLSFFASSRGAGALKSLHQYQCRLDLWTHHHHHHPWRRQWSSLHPSTLPASSSSLSSVSSQEDSWAAGATAPSAAKVALVTHAGDDSEANQKPNASKSNRQAFRDVPVHASVLQYIQRVGVGIPSRKRRRRRQEDDGKAVPVPTPVDASNHRRAETAPPPPPPFGPNSRVRAVATLGSVADLTPYLHVDDGMPSQRSTRSDGSGGRKGSSWVVPEVVLAGRSNVGKSTLLNALLYGNKQRPNNSSDDDVGNAIVATIKGVGKGADKAAMSPRPGETRQITLYHISSSSSSSSSTTETQSKANDASSSTLSSRGGSSACLRVADLPGYGFAYSGTADKEEFVKRYVLGRDPRALKRLLLLVDARHGLKQADANFLARLQSETIHDPVEDEGDAALVGGGKSAKQRQQQQRRHRRGAGGTLPPIQIVLTKCDLVPQADLARRVTLVRRQLAEMVRREPGNLPVMLVAARSTLLPPPRPKGGFGSNPIRRRDGVLELQRELAALVAPSTRR